MADADGTIVAVALAGARSLARQAKAATSDAQRRVLLDLLADELPTFVEAEAALKRLEAR